MKANLPGHMNESQPTKVKSSYLYKDTGCERAKIEGYDGPCQECQFNPCLLEPKVYKALRNAEIRRRWRTGETPKHLASEFRVSLRTIQRVIRKD